MSCISSRVHTPSDIALVQHTCKWWRCDPHDPRAEDDVPSNPLHWLPGLRGPLAEPLLSNAPTCASQDATVYATAHAGRETPRGEADGKAIVTGGWGYLPGPSESVNVVVAWVYRVREAQSVRHSHHEHRQLVTSRKYQAGGLGVDAPVLAQAYASLGRAYDGFESCRSVVETPFPFPWSQVLRLPSAEPVHTTPCRSCWSCCSFTVPVCRLWW